MTYLKCKQVLLLAEKKVLQGMYLAQKRCYHNLVILRGGRFQWPEKYPLNLIRIMPA